MVNEALSTYIGKVYYNLSDDASITLQLSNDRDYNIGFDEERTQLKNAAGKTLFEISKDAIFTRSAGIELELDRSYDGA